MYIVNNMKQNILIGLLAVIVILLSVKIISPTVITAKKTIPSAASDSGKQVVTETTEESNTIKLEKEEISSSSDFGFRKQNFEKTTQNIEESSPKIENQRAADYYEREMDVKTPPVPKFQPIVKVIPESATSVQQPKNFPPQSEFEKNITSCKPYSEKMSAEYMGMLVDYELYIRGWINNKCVIDFKSNVKGVGSSFAKTYNIDAKDAQIFTFAPIVKCQFSKEQLEYVGDSILQEKEREKGASNNMLKNPNSVHLPDMKNMSQSDAKLLEVVLGHNACEMQNDGNLHQMVNDLFN